MENTWSFEGQKLFRAEKLYTAQNYQIFLETLRKNFPDYVYFCPFRGKEVISAPLNSIKQVFVPRECLHHLTKFEDRDSLQNMTLDLINLLSADSDISMQDFGVHGSVALDMHTSKSDIDLVVYGAHNFRKLEKTMNKLADARILSYKSSNRLDAARRCKGKYLNRVFMYNAIRKPEEINSKYGASRYVAIAPVKFECKIRDDSEAMFRPAIYKIREYTPVDATSALTENMIPKLLVSMIGCYRNVGRRGDAIRVTGMLERVENLQTGRVFHQAVVGTGINEGERICPP